MEKYRNTVDRHSQSSLPPRNSSLYPIIAPCEAPPPIPLSRMTFEELMEVLPRLDAAIIAHDWLPCMQRRQKEIKQIMQAQNDSLRDNKAGSQDIGEDFLKTVTEVENVAASFHDLFETAKGLQRRDIQNWTAELEEANNKRYEAVSVLARHVSMHNEKCDTYERQIEKLQVDNRQMLRDLASSILQNLSDTPEDLSKKQIEEILQSLMILDNDPEHLSNFVSKQVYMDMEQSLNKAKSERESLRKVCTQQMDTIRTQSLETDQYLSRMAKVIGLVQEKEKEYHKLRSENDALRKEVATLHKELSQSQKQPEIVNYTQRNASLSREHIDKKDWSHDAEISNLRCKLTQAIDREHGLNQQIRQLLHTSHTTHPEKRTNRFKRLLKGGALSHEHSSSLPRGSSMLDLSQTSLYPDNDKFHETRYGSPSKSDTYTPTMTVNSSITFEPLELPPFFDPRNTTSATDLPARSRAALAASQLDDDKDIEYAVSSRFNLSSVPRGDMSVAMPANVRTSGRSPLISAKEPWRSISKPTPSFQTQDSHFQGGSSDLQQATAGSRLPRSPSMVLFQPNEGHRVLSGYSRVLSGITEVSETDTVDFKRKVG